MGAQTRTIYWSIFLHFYQPPTQNIDVLRKIYRESYKPLVKLFKAYPSQKVTVNMCGVLTEMLRDVGLGDVLKGMAELAENEQLEFCESAKYHAILPLIPEKESVRQITLNAQANRALFGDAYKPKGFFPPEMCYSEKVAEILEKLRYKWVILGGVACNLAWPTNIVYKIRNHNVHVFFRDDILSNKISFRTFDSKGFIQELITLADNRPPESQGDMYVITAMDAETYGHHIKDWEKIFLEQSFIEIEKRNKTLGKMHRKNASESSASPQEGLQKGDYFIKTATISELYDLFAAPKAITPRPSSWSTSLEDIEHKNYYPLWKDPRNQLHALLWEHMDIAIDLARAAVRTSKVSEEARSYGLTARHFLDQALHSCQFWWANKPSRWSVNLIHKGLLLQEEAILNAYKAISLFAISDAAKNKYYHKVLAARELEFKIKDEIVS